MSIKISSLVWQHYPAGGSELLTALAYADHAHDDGTSIRPSVEYVARKTRQSERTVQRYLASMRNSGWLQTVRFARGGRGYATEYRINPLWIRNPDTLPPISNPDSNWVTSTAAKADNEGSKRTTGVTPQPPRNVSETTPLHSDDELRSLSWPKSLQTKAAAEMIRRCPAETRQTILDEIAALQEQGRVRSAIGLLRSLVERAIVGEFSPIAAQKRNSQIWPDRTQKQRTKTTQRTADTQSSSNTIGREYVSILKKMLKP